MEKWPEQVRHEIQSEAHEIYGWVGDAAGDMAGCSEDQAKFIHSMDPKRLKQIEQAKKNGVIDIPGWLADEIYNEVDTLCDLTGDRIHDAGYLIARKCKLVNGKERVPDALHYEIMIAVAEDMKDLAHHALIVALDIHIKDWKERLKKAMERKKS